MTMRTNLRVWSVVSVLLLTVASSALVCGDTITPSQYWKNQIEFPDDSFCSETGGIGGSEWVKFTIILLENYDSNLVYFQDCRKYIFHYDFAAACLDPFMGMTANEYYQVALYEQGQQAAMGTVIMPPLTGSEPDFQEYGIQFVRQDPYTREEIVDMFNLVKANISADPDVTAFYFPTYEQSEVAWANKDWFESQGIPVSSISRWSEGNACYSEGWALGELKFFEAGQIDTAYQSGDLLPGDILLTDGIPAEIPFVAGIISLAPATPSSHVALLAQTYGVPFVHLALAEDADRAGQLVGHKIVFSAYDDGSNVYDVRLINVEGVLTEQQIEEILALKEPPELGISPMASYSDYSESTDGLTPADIQYFGGKASNFGILRTAIPGNSPVAIAFSFDLWNEFLDQTIAPRESVIIEPGGYLLFWADEEEDEGPTHTNFKLNAGGFYDDIGLYDSDGTTLLDGIGLFPPQAQDISYGRYPDGNGNWQYFGSSTPGWSNSGGSGGPTEGLFINEFMADNDHIIQDNFGDYDDCIELYNAGTTAIDLGGMYLTDRIDEPTMWMIPYGISGSTLREEINNRLSAHTTYPPDDMAALSRDLAAIRSIIKDADLTSFSPQLQAAVIAALAGFDINENIRFRSSTNVEDSEQFIGAGMYDSYSGCLADDLDGNNDGPCLCDPNEDNEQGAFRAIRKVFASFYNDNAFLERLRHRVNEADVGMALLVHHSFPDGIELANGVATIERVGSGYNSYITLITQDGAVSVTNPQDGSIPEEVTVRVYSSGSIGSPKLIRSSNLVPLGDTVMDWPNDYRDLTELLVDVSNEFSNVTGKTQYLIDLEYKKVAPGGVAMPAGGLVIKQVREIPQLDDTPSITPFLINEPTEYSIYSGEFEFMGDCDIFASHRLKTRLTLETKNLWLDEPNLAQGFYATANIEYVDGDSVYTITEELPLLPFAWHDFDGTDATDGWLMDHLPNPRACELNTTNIPTLVSPAQNPILALRDFGDQPAQLDEPRFRVLKLNVDYDQPVRSWLEGCLPDGITNSTTNELYLWCCPGPSPDDIVQQRFYESDGISIETEFYRPPPPSGFSNWMTHTAPMTRWVETTITGYTSVPIVLSGYYSQTYQAWHHNKLEYFLFEPRLEPGISQDILDELQAQDIRLIYMIIDNDYDYQCPGCFSNITTYGFDYVPGDFNGDSIVNMADFAMMAQYWLDPDACASAQVNLTGGDTQVDMEDLLELSNNWLQTESE